MKITQHHSGILAPANTVSEMTELYVAPSATRGCNFTNNLLGPSQETNFLNVLFSFCEVVLGSFGVSTFD